MKFGALLAGPSVGGGNMFGRGIALIAMAAIHSPSFSQAVKSTITASNGIAISVYSDEFANRYEYSAPKIDIPDGFVLVGAIKKGGVANPPTLQGAFIYSGEWRRYSSALFRGGDRAAFVALERNVGRCSSSRYSRPSCTLTEEFRIDLSTDDIRKHSEGGVVAIQVRADDTTTAIIEVPVAYIDAVNEVEAR